MKEYELSLKKSTILTNRKQYHKNNKQNFKKSENCFTMFMVNRGQNCSNLKIPALMLVLQHMGLESSIL